ncbi:uncharacterized protein PV06_07970 [Exophiala oligosperma]|uniref:Uncharacterized protein n=1 Tax=Exophiala oligosperma TaxID=215243 RepID=A0A0D2BTK7_9EURO|nr:uncharacterized protein PV06_07970 [Exophiala oligosperma]KIW40797.1 hypothetical protein PV06_07970 [Exophiala oligosperma]
MEDQGGMEDNTTKLTTEEYLELMESVGYNVEGRTVPHLWGAYSSIFNDVREIGRTNKENFIRKFEPHDPYVVAKRIQANGLVEKAWSCFKRRDNEFGWRKEVEFRAFECFDSEVACHVCLKRLSKVKFEARPIDPGAAEDLRRRRLRRRLCECTPLQRAVFMTTGSNEYPRIFTREIDRPIFHEDMSSQMRRRLRTQRPDRVIGLARTRTFKHLLPSLRKRCSAFNKRHVLYPFIVIEAKAAENTSNASFGSMLRQTAFAVRTCMRLQQNLKDETGLDHQCLVWNFVILGEDWRLYAAVPDGDGVQLFDLWHGSILHEDGAFQLLLILDYLCDWASDVYRPSILACLAGGRTNLRQVRLSPSGTEASSQMSEIGISNFPDISLPLRSSTAPEQAHAELVGDLDADKETILQRHRQPDPASSSATENALDTHQWRKWEEADPDEHPWAAHATIRHSNVVQYSYWQLILPVDKKVLENCLEVVFPKISAEEAARQLVNTMCDTNMTVKTRWKFDAKQMPPGESPGVEILVRALVYAQCALKPENWRITRRLSCILCSQRALQQLAEIAHVVLPPTGLVDDEIGSGINCQQVLQAIDKLKLCSGQKSAGLAMFRRQLCLRATHKVSDGFEELEWFAFSHQSSATNVGTIKTTRKLASVIASTFFGRKRHPTVAPVLAPYVEAESTLHILPTDHEMDNLARREADALRFKSPGILIKKPTTWPGKTPEFCLLVTEENVDFEDEVRLGEMIEEAQAADEVFGVVKEHANCGGSTEDMAAIFSQWAKNMKGVLD